MKVSGFTFLNGAVSLGYPFRESIRSALPLCDEFVVVVGDTEDGTAEAVAAMGDPRIKVYRSSWNRLVGNFVLAQQTNVAYYSCTGDWAFYIQGDEILHEEDQQLVMDQMRKHLDNPKVEGLAFDYVHFYGNHNTQAWSPRWYRREVRVFKNSLRLVFPSDGLFAVLLKTSRRARYLNAVVTGAKMYHYGWVRSDSLHQGGQTKKDVYEKVDPDSLRLFTGTHPKIIQPLLKNEVKGLFPTHPGYRLTWRERRHKFLMVLERVFGLDFAKNHFRRVKG